MRDTSAAAAAFRNRNGSILEAAAATVHRAEGAFCGEEKKRERD